MHPLLSVTIPNFVVVIENDFLSKQMSSENAVNSFLGKYSKEVH